MKLRKSSTRGALIALAATLVVATTTAAATGADHDHRDDSSHAQTKLTLESTVLLAGGLSASTTSGSFAVAGAITDSGTEAGSGYFEGGGATPTGPNILHATQTFTGANGTVTISLMGDFGPLPAQTAEGTGWWQVTSGTGAYDDLHARGRWHALADFTAAQAHTGPPSVTFMLTGRADS